MLDEEDRMIGKTGSVLALGAALTLFGCGSTHHHDVIHHTVTHVVPHSTVTHHVVVHHIAPKVKSKIKTSLTKKH